MEAKRDMMKKVPVREQDPKVRATNFKEVCLGYNMEEAVAESERCLNCKNAKCIAGCPVSIDIPAFIQEVKAGNIEEAAKVIALSSALPAVCGRVCPQESQCEGQCVRGIKGEAVSIGKLERFVADWMDAFEGATVEEAEKIYEGIRLPRRATAGSAGYDFFSPVDFTIKPGETVKFPTGIRVEMDQEWVLKCYPRSGLGFKYRLQLNNTVGIIDSDYYNSDNEGHIFAKLTNDSNEEKTVQIKAGEGFMQGIFVEYGITVDDAATDVRNGGFGSTTK